MVINTDYRIKKAYSMNDISNVFYLNGVIFPEDSLEELDNNYYWLAWKEKKPVGFACLKVLEDGVGYMTRGGVLEGHQGKGLHTRLVDARIRYARKHNLKYIITYTLTENVWSLASLVRRGFQIYNPSWEYAGGKCTYLLYEL
jgi:GNAT superfamily N-acetyltransferase